MFFHKKQPADWPLIFLGLIALGIVVSTAVLVVLVRSKATKANLNQVLPSAPRTFSAEEYYQEMEGLVEMASSTDKDLSSVFAKVEDKFFNVHVPAEMRDKHLTALFKIMKLKKENEKGVKTNANEELIKILEILKY